MMPEWAMMAACCAARMDFEWYAQAPSSMKKMVAKISVRAKSDMESMVRGHEGWLDKWISYRKRMVRVNMGAVRVSAGKRWVL